MNMLNLLKEIAPKQTVQSPATVMDIKELSYEQLRIEFMRISPTYAFASHVRGLNLQPNQIDVLVNEFYEAGHKASYGKGRGRQMSMYEPLTSGQKASLQVDFEHVLHVFDEYGDINKPYKNWYEEKGWNIFDSAYRRSVEKVTTVQKDAAELRESAEDLVDYLTNIEKQSQFPKSILLNIPTNLPKRMAVERVLHYLDIYTDKDAQYEVLKPLVSKRRRLGPLVMKLKLLMLRSLHPDRPLWWIGLTGGVSKTYTTMLSFEDNTNEKIQDYRQRLGILTSRALMNAEYIAEHAARDVFPLNKPIITPVFDYSVIRERIVNAWPSLV